MTIELLEIERKNGITTGRCRNTEDGSEKFFHVVANITDEQLIDKLARHFKAEKLVMSHHLADGESND